MPGREWRTSRRSATGNVRWRWPPTRSVSTRSRAWLARGRGPRDGVPASRVRSGGEARRKACQCADRTWREWRWPCGIRHGDRAQRATNGAFGSRKRARASTHCVCMESSHAAVDSTAQPGQGIRHVGHSCRWWLSWHSHCRSLTGSPFSRCSKRAPQHSRRFTEPDLSATRTLHSGRDRTQGAPR